MVTTIDPLYDRVLLKRIEIEDTTPSGLFIPDAAKEKGQMGLVIRVGTGKINSEGKTIPLTVKAGDTVFFGKYSGTEVGKDHLILKEDEILGIVIK